MPDHWQRFSENGALSDFGRRIDDRDWVDGFLLSEEDYRNTPNGSFDGQMEIQLRPLDREVVAWLAENPGGHPLHSPLRALRKRAAGSFRETFPENERTPDGKAAKLYLDEAIGRRLSGGIWGCWRNTAPLTIMNRSARMSPMAMRGSSLRCLNMPERGSIRIR